MKNIEYSHLKELIRKEINERKHNFEEKYIRIYTDILDESYDATIVNIFSQPRQEYFTNIKDLVQLLNAALETENLQFVISLVDYSDKLPNGNSLINLDITMSLGYLLTKGNKEILEQILPKINCAQFEFIFTKGNYIVFDQLVENCQAVRSKYEETLKYVYMLAEDFKVSKTVIENLNYILIKHHYNLEEFIQQVKEYRYDYNLPKQITKGAKNLTNFMQVSKNPELTLTSDNGQHILNKDIMLNHVLKYVAGIKGPYDQYNIPVIEQLHENKQKILNLGAATSTTEKTSVEQVKARAVAKNEKPLLNF